MKGLSRALLSGAARIFCRSSSVIFFGQAVEPTGRGGMERSVLQRTSWVPLHQGPLLRAKRRLSSGVPSFWTVSRYFMFWGATCSRCSSSTSAAAWSSVPSRWCSCTDIAPAEKASS